jgi:outer membrane lipoprotein LolB
MRRPSPWRWLQAGVLAATTALAACASPHGARAPAHDLLSAYVLDARFGLRDGDSSYSGRLNWRHDPEGDSVLLQDPFGGGVAELDAGPRGARMRLSDGQTAEADDARELMHRVTGVALPVRDLARWLTARGTDGAAATAERDARGRVVRQVRQGWAIEYSYDDAAADALPARIFAANGQGIELRLAIEAWATGAAR